jgi:REP element-mobilizing transposase RayT
VARPLRIVFPGAWYHVTNRGLERRAIFPTVADGTRFLDLIAQVSARFALEVHAFCLMSNHYHLLVRTPLGNLSEAMRHLDGVYTQRFNRSHGRDGPLFRGRFACVLVQADRHLVCAARYIHLNPVEAGLVDRPEDWPRSSYRGYLDPRLAPAWLHTRVVLGWFGPTGGRERHRAFVEQGVDGSTASFFGRSRRPPVLGSAIYRASLSATLDDVASVAGVEMPDVDRLAVRPSLDAIARCVVETFDVAVDRLPARRGRSTRREALARGALVDLAVRAGRHPLKRVAAWLGYARATSAANAARRFRAACEDSPEVRARLAEIVSGLRQAGAREPDPASAPRHGTSDEDASIPDVK